jgi:hypothetical protein
MALSGFLTRAQITPLMSKKILLFAIVAMLSGGVLATDVDMDSDLMQTIEDAAKSIDSNIATKDAKRATADAKELEELFKQVETYFVRKGNAEDGVKSSQKSKELASQVAKSVAAQDFDTASDAAQDMVRACKSCHDTYKPPKL